MCSDVDKSNSCNGEEELIPVNIADGSFALTASKDIPLTAEFYEEPSSSSGISVSVMDGKLPVLVYTTPAGEKPLSAFTTIVKNKVDQNPLYYTVNLASDEVKETSGIEDPFKKESYTDADIAKIHTVVSEVVEGLLNYLATVLSVTPETFTPAHTAALYNIVSDMVTDIADDPVSADADSLVSGVESGVSQEVTDADTALNEAAAAKDWNISADAKLYEVDCKGSIFTLDLIQTGAQWKIWRRVGLDETPAGEPDFNASLTTIGITPVKSLVTSLSTISVNDRYGSFSISLSSGAEVYTQLFTHDYTEEIDGIVYLQKNFETINSGNDSISIGAYDLGTANFNTDKIQDSFGNLINIFGTKFKWTGEGNQELFSEDYGFVKSGSFAKSGSEDKEVYTFTASDGSIAYLFHPEGNSSQWALATYPVFNERMVLFNKTATQDIVNGLEISLNVNVCRFE
ncbi:MAG: hypothetical protein LBD73_03135 [Deferribacteraceae bacterium]|nr:hypothetical protein [Deferribacteraceae bacterium]